MFTRSPIIYLSLHYSRTGFVFAKPDRFLSETIIIDRRTVISSWCYLFIIIQGATPQFTAEGA